MLHSHRTAPVLGGIALALSALAVASATTDVSFGSNDRSATPDPQPDRVLRLGHDKRFPPEAIPTVAKAQRTDSVGRMTLAGARDRCPPSAVGIGTWCIDATVRGTADYAAASRACVRVGGYLPSAAELVGAAPRVRLSSRLDDDAGKALVDPSRRRDLRELSADLFTTTTGPAAAGSSTAPAPATLQAVTVVDNRNRGGAAGGVPVGTPERFRCAYVKYATGPVATPRVVVRSARSRDARRISVAVEAPRAGRLSAVASVRSKGRTVVVGRAARRVRAAGATSLTVRPTAAGRRLLLRRTGSARVRLTVELRPASGRLSSTVVQHTVGTSRG